MDLSRSLREAKLRALVEAEGFASLDDLLAAVVTDSVCPAICATAGCSYTCEMEPDQDRGWCELCGRTPSRVRWSWRSLSDDRHHTAHSKAQRLLAVHPAGRARVHDQRRPGSRGGRHHGRPRPNGRRSSCWIAVQSGSAFNRVPGLDPPIGANSSASRPPSVSVAGNG